MSARTNRWLVAAAVAVLILGALLSRVIEPGIRVEKVMLATNPPHASRVISSDHSKPESRMEFSGIQAFHRRYGALFIAQTWPIGFLEPPEVPFSKALGLLPVPNFPFEVHEECLTSDRQTFSPFPRPLGLVLGDHLRQGIIEIPAKLLQGSMAQPLEQFVEIQKTVAPTAAHQLPVS